MKIQVIKFLTLLGIVAGLFFGCSSKRNKTPIGNPVESAVTSVKLDTLKKEQAPEKAKDTLRAPSYTQAVSPKEEETSIKVTLPRVQREFRAAWVATVANINWPSRNNLSTDQQKAEAVHLLDMLKENNFNAVIFQVRPSADALYQSQYEPWSYFLTGEIGKKPYPFYDPLEFWIEEAHKRGLELHVWLNPYRAHHTNGGSVTGQSMVNRASDHIVRLKNGMYWFDPADQRTQDHAAAVVKDIVKRYDIDGVHFDDYFYPYASYNGGADFPDNKTWNAYRSAGGHLSRADWRRYNVNKFIERVYADIKAEKNYVKFGLSPFGIWKPGYPAGVTGSSQYDELYADAKLWLNKGWIDYFTPQLYWPINPSKQSFTALLKWWQSENTHNRHLWPGLNTVGVSVSDKPTEIVNQIEATREIIPNSVGAVHWSIAGLTKSPTMLNKISNGPYRQKSLIPKSPWLSANPLLQPTLLLTIEKGNIFAKWLHKQPDQVFHWVLYSRYGDTWETEILDANITAMEFGKSKNGKNLNAVAVQAIDRLGNESEYIAKSVKLDI
ncbi:glycoside hydrolase family 10 protein [Sphingobacterium lumbrici]|uniref:glycoside hydrolase family 10 protein n=1 Tax=Sphingobacterium lumbrici TaxID=2559600 RepID=UPI00112BE2DA|nr:family 10 glycosylhydrolase [Sphingobacterium lumbrici]